MKNKTQIFILALTALVAIAEGSLGLLAELGLSGKEIAIVRLVGFVAITILGILKTQENKVLKEEKDGGTKPPIGGGGGTPPKP